MAERRIRVLQEGARTTLIHAAHCWPGAIEPALWSYALRNANDVLNSTPTSTGGIPPYEAFRQVPTTIRLRHFHHFGCPVYVLDSDLHAGKKLTRHKWQDCARVGINLGPSPNHSQAIHLVLNLQTGLVLPQFHVKFDGHFETTRKESGVRMPPSQWQRHCHLLHHQQHTWILQGHVHKHQRLMWARYMWRYSLQLILSKKEFSLNRLRLTTGPDKHHMYQHPHRKNKTTQIPNKTM